MLNLIAQMRRRKIIAENPDSHNAEISKVREAAIRNIGAQEFLHTPSYYFVFYNLAVPILLEKDLFSVS